MRYKIIRTLFFGLNLCSDDLSLDKGVFSSGERGDNAFELQFDEHIHELRHGYAEGVAQHIDVRVAMFLKIIEDRLLFGSEVGKDFHLLCILVAFLGVPTHR